MSNTMHVCWIGMCKNSESYGSRAVHNGTSMGATWKKTGGIGRPTGRNINSHSWANTMETPRLHSIQRKPWTHPGNRKQMQLRVIDPECSWFHHSSTKSHMHWYSVEENHSQHIRCAVKSNSTKTLGPKWSSKETGAQVMASFQRMTSQTSTIQFY